MACGLETIKIENFKYWRFITSKIFWNLQFFKKTSCFSGLANAKTKFDANFFNFSVGSDCFSAKRV
jgi:hypothetical protein